MRVAVGRSTCTLSREHTHYTHTHTYTHTRTHTYAHIHTHMNTHIIAPQIYAYIHRFLCVYTHMNITHTQDTLTPKPVCAQD